MTRTDIFTLHALMADHGDCLWIEYGQASAPHRILVDGGTTGTFQRLKPMLEAVRTARQISHELLVVTHVDADHIAGVLPILSSEDRAAQFKEIWFNGRAHLEQDSSLEIMGAVQGEALSDAIRARQIAWNELFAKKSVVLGTNDEAKVTTLPGGATVTILSPGWPQLADMAKAWDKEIKKAGLKNGSAAEPPANIVGLEALGAINVELLSATEFDEDNAPANGSSIAMLIEYKGKRVLLGADAHPSVLVNAIRKHTNDKPLEVDVFKLPHHGSKYNVNNELLKWIKAKTYVFSSNGAYFKHPDQEAVAKVIRHAPYGATLAFNCKTAFNRMWGDSSLQEKWGYNAIFGENDNGISISIEVQYQHDE